eukprot:m51a1_g10878 putative adp-ribosylation factor gtpase-activating protein agd12 (657) ;mRNA; f:24337-27084
MIKVISLVAHAFVVALFVHNAIKEPAQLDPLAALPDDQVVNMVDCDALYGPLSAYSATSYAPLLKFACTSASLCGALLHMVRAALGAIGSRVVGAIDGTSSLVSEAPALAVAVLVGVAAVVVASIVRMRTSAQRNKDSSSASSGAVEITLSACPCVADSSSPSACSSAMEPHAATDSQAHIDTTARVEPISNEDAGVVVHSVISESAHDSDAPLNKNVDSDDFKPQPVASEEPHVAATSDTSGAEACADIIQGAHGALSAAYPEEGSHDVDELMPHGDKSKPSTEVPLAAVPTIIIDRSALCSETAHADQLVSACPTLVEETASVAEAEGNRPTSGDSPARCPEDTGIRTSADHIDVLNVDEPGAAREAVSPAGQQNADVAAADVAGSEHAQVASLAEGLIGTAARMATSSEEAMMTGKLSSGRWATHRAVLTTRELVLYKGEGVFVSKKKADHVFKTIPVAFGAVKKSRRNHKKFKIITAAGKCSLTAETKAMMNSIEGSSADKNVGQLREIPQDAVCSQAKQLCEMPGNDVCADCGAPKPCWASINLGILVCLDCSGAHRALGTHISKVRSLVMDTCWADEDIVKTMTSIGNAKSNAYWEARLPFSGDSKPGPQSTIADRMAFVRSKYADSKYTAATATADGCGTEQWRHRRTL